MKKLVSILGVVLMIVAVAIPALAGTESPEKPVQQAPQPEKPAQPAPQKMAKARSLTATIVSIDQQEKTVTVKSGKKATEHTFAVEGKQADTLAHFKAGDKVKISYMEAEGKLIAKTIKLLRKKG